MASRYNRPIPGSPEPSVHDMLKSGHELRVLRNEKKYDLVVAKDKTVLKTIDSFPKEGDAITYGENFFGVKPRRLVKAAA